ncbi:MAG TPA: DUF362 domain-containing protein [Syntrophorhabdales bacterium]|nr:DUF362 domain-containing protein [Syntrophorhabdales bacterium]
MKEREGALNFMNRREFLSAVITGCMGLAAGGAAMLGSGCTVERRTADAFIGKAGGYYADIPSIIGAGLRELGVARQEIEGKRILLKPNLIESRQGAAHITTHPLMIQGAIEAFRKYGAAEIIVAEGPGHCRDTLLVLEETGLIDVLRSERITFTDLNQDSWYTVRNAGGRTKLKQLILPETLKRVDWIVSMPKLKTHHWAGITLSMKNLFGVMPGIFYGWPKNVFHWEGIEKSIFDINVTVGAHFTIVDGIVGMEGDGPIMGKPKQAGVIVMGTNLVAADATCARIMGINPQKVAYLAAAAGRLGPIKESNIFQRGEKIESVRTNFELLQNIKAHRGLRSI